MGTRSIITFYDVHNGTETKLVRIYQQYDGYLEGVGRELCEWLLGKKMIDGITFEQKSAQCTNGTGCLAAKFIHDFKKEIGGLYIVGDNYENQDYNYDVYINFNNDGFHLDEMTTIKVSNFDAEPFFVGSPSSLMSFIKSGMEFEDEY